MAEDEGRWSIWYNRDRPWIGDGDFETVELIEENFGPICPRGQKIMSSVCRLTMFMEEFTQSTSGRLPDHLQIPCTTQGLLCRNDHQKEENGMCNDYAIKFLCQDTTDSDDKDEGSPFPQFDVRIYIILAVVPILIFLFRIIWAYVFRRRRRQRRSAGRGRRHRGGRDGDHSDDDNSSIASSLANPPPTYKELFGETGPNRSSVFAISGRNIPVCEHCKEASCSVVTALQTRLENPPNTETTAVPRSVSNSTTLTNVASHYGSISSNLENAANVTPSPNSSSLSPSPSDTSAVIDNSNTQNTSSVGDDVDLERHDTTEQTVMQDIRALNDPDSPQSHFVSSTSYVNMENETNNECENNNDNHSDILTHHVTSNGPFQIIQSNLQQQQPILTPLSVRNGPSPPRPSHNKISDPCACTCHRTIPYKGRGLTGCDNPGFHHENCSESVDSTRAPPPGIHRVWSNLSTGSTLTLSELPSYQDALELIKKKEAEAMQTSN